MGWGKILKKVKKVGNVVDPHALAIHTIQTKTPWGAKLGKNVDAEGTKGVASYGGYAGVVAQVIPGVGTAVGAGLIAASVAAQIKLKQEALAKQEHANAAQERAWAAADAAALADAAPGNDNAAVFTPTVPAGATTKPPLVTDYIGGNTGSVVGGSAGLIDSFLSPGAGSASFAPNAAGGGGPTSYDSAPAAPASGGGLMVPLVIGGVVLAALGLTVLALKR